VKSPGPRDHSRRRAPNYLSSERRLGTASLHPSGILSERNSPVSADWHSCLQGPSGPTTRGDSDPRIVVPDGLLFAGACCHSGDASPWGGSAPTRQVLPPRGRIVVPTALRLRRPPADKLVKSGTREKLIAEHRLGHRMLSRIPQSLLVRASRWAAGPEAHLPAPTGKLPPTAEKLSQRLQR